MDNPIDDIRKQLGSKNMLLGEREVMKAILTGKIKKVYLAKNCKETMRRDIMRAQEIAKFDVITLDLVNEEVGTLCKKPFSVAVIGVIA
jgi:large subunit ribosomal protein L30e